MTEKKVSQAKRRANEKWDKANKDRVNYLKKRSAAISFIKKYALDEDLQHIEDAITERKTNGPIQ